MYNTKAVIIAMIITAVVSISVTVFCFQTKVRASPGPSFTWWGSLDVACGQTWQANVPLH